MHRSQSWEERLRAAVHMPPPRYALTSPVFSLRGDRRFEKPGRKDPGGCQVLVVDQYMACT